MKPSEINPEDIKVLLTPKSIVVTFKDKKRTYLKDNGDFSLVQYLILKEQWTDLVEIMDKNAAAEALGLKVEKDEVVTPEGKPAHPTLVDRITDGYPNETLRAFKARCDANVWPKAIGDLLCFLKDKAMPITKKGTFLAWKSIRKDYTDHHSGTFDNHPGKAPRMKREDCEANRSNPCGRGFHAGTYAFACGFHQGDQRLIIVEVDPANVTSVPHDANEQKLRCDHYTVLEEVHSGQDHKETITRIAEKITGEDQEEFTTKIQKATQAKKPTPPKAPAQEPSKKEILNYALHLKKTKKGDAYAAQMIQTKFPKGIKTLKELIKDPKNPARINKATKEILQKIVAAA